MGIKALVGTSKGLVILNSKPKWHLEKVQFKGFAVTMVFVDKYSGHWWLGLSHNHWGQKLHRSKDAGETWEEVKTPRFTVDYSPGQLANLTKIWVMESGGDENELWMGTEPGALFYSDNNGDDFHLIESLWNHPSRENRNQWFATGSKYPFLHSIQVNPLDPEHIYVAISCAGVFESKDKGKNWTVQNKGLEAAYLPRPDVEIGHDPHLLLIHPKQPNVLWQQNHCGVFRTEDGANAWIKCTSEEALPHYGFPIAIDEEDPLKAWVIPAESDERRIPKNLKLEVYRTEDGGKHWINSSDGLPNDVSFDLVLRQAFIKHKNVLLFGTTNGNLYLSENNGLKWTCISNTLGKISNLRFAI